MVETAVYAQWIPRNIIIAYANPSSELKSLKTFMKKNNLSHTIVTSISETGKKEMSYGCLQFMPVAYYAYTVGENTLKTTKQSYGL